MRAAKPATWDFPWRPLLLPFGLVLTWAAFSAFQEQPSSSSLLVAPSALVKVAIADIADGSLPGAIAATLARALAGYGLGVAGGLALGLLLGLSRWARDLVAPTIDGARQIALFAWIPLLSAWLGNGEAMKVTLIALGSFFPVALATAAGCANVPSPFREVGRALELDRRTTIRRIILPAAAPSIIAGLELSLNIAWLGTIGAEYLIGTGYINGMGDGLGAYLAAARELAAMDRVLLGVLALALVGLLLDRSIALLSRRMLPWQAR